MFGDGCIFVVFVRNSGVLVRILCFCEVVVLKWVGGRGEGGIVNLLVFVRFGVGFVRRKIR